MRAVFMRMEVNEVTDAWAWVVYDDDGFGHDFGHDYDAAYCWYLRHGGK